MYALFLLIITLVIHKYLIIKNNIIFEFIREFFIGLLSVCTVVSFSGSLQSNYNPAGTQYSGNIP